MNQGDRYMTMNLVNWNVQWPTPRSKRTPEILRRIEEYTPDVICLTESNIDLLSPNGYVICSQPDYGYKTAENRRKVMLWSREPWDRVDDLGHESMPPGRYVSGITKTPSGELTVVGVCIPWHGSRTEERQGLGRKKIWEDHESFLNSLSGVLSGLQDRPLVIAGDFNQRIGQRGYSSRELQSVLHDTMPERVTIATSALGYAGRRSIDHIALSDDLVAESLSVVSNIAGESKLSDHFGVAAKLSIRR